MDVNKFSLQSELENLFRTKFLEAAPLYQASSKFKLPYEDLKSTTTLYHGSRHSVVRTVEEVADYEIAKDGFTEDFARAALAKLATAAGSAVDGLIRLENVRSHRDHDPRNTVDMKVVDIFEHADGRRNLQLMVVDTPKALNFPDGQIPPWVAYRFYFAAAVVSSEYKKA